MVAFLSARRFHGLVAFAAFALLGVAFYMEYQMGLEPCPLCMFQRIAFFAIGVVSLISALRGSISWHKKLAWPIVVLSLLGAGLAIRHLYLQNLPAEELPACLPGLSYMFEVFPWQEILEAMVMGTGECGDVVWTFLGLSIPGWTLVAFVGMALVNLWIALKAK
ncbi:MAG: disulfide bond formation protein B [Marinomonas sp.]|jgi:disulfide bond formation protein DsbB|uniref:Disulfide bond formation protein B n=1 Tax=Marinomonas communis TaxID=28254 RepID=A0A4R6X2C6_9GAMM|nr:disulfide bond formation protein B [Marinomonas communis]MAF16658.1 disulfide bond formation protein B [Marinomonas sp.]TDR13055.1 disulfide bond formation protein DsbB [Marinomonas communis]